MAEVQTKLNALGYWLGPIDGIFGSLTAHGVVALQKAAGLPRTGIVDAPTRAALDAGTRPTARSQVGRVAEVQIGRQLLLLVRDGHVDWIVDTSTGRAGFETPTGQYAIYAEVDAANVAGAYRPKYFYDPRDLAIHGYSNVPPYPASHGCARVPIPAMDWLWAAGLLPIGTPVLIY